MSIDIEFWRQALKTNQLWMSMATVREVSIDASRAFMRATVTLMPTEYEARVYVGAEYVAPGVGVYYPLRQNDLVVVGFPSGDQDSGVLIKRLSSREDTIPTEFNNDKIVIKMTDDESLEIIGNTMKFGSSASTENLVLGQIFKGMMSTLLGALAVHKHISMPPGFPTTPPDNLATYTSLKASPVDNENILSDKAFTEK